MAAFALEPGQYYGTTETRECAGAILSVVRHAVEQTLPAHTHELPFSCLLLEGEYAERAAGETVTYEPLTLVYHPARLAHSDRVFADSRMFAVELRDRWHHTLAQCGAPDRSLHTLSGGEPLWLMLRLYELFTANVLSEITVESLIFDLIGSFQSLETADADRSQGWLNELRSYLDGSFTEPLQISDLARRFAVHPVHLSRSFRQRFKSNVGDYVHRRRIQRACRLLSSSRAPLSSIASELGYWDQSHFNRTFYAFTGTTPGRFRALSGSADLQG
ncbi:MAG: AraC family transcriptional regulator [Candidatus Cybelea sp.]